jgi:hypothetical protein
MTVTEVARHLQLDWKTVKEIDKHYLEAHYVIPTMMGSVSWPWMNYLSEGAIAT